MMILIELLILLSTIMPVFHLINALTGRKSRLLRPETEKKFSILIPCFNEEETVRFSIKGLLDMDYREYEAIYINDGSTDSTFEVLSESLDLVPVIEDSESMSFYRSEKHPGFFVVDKPNGGKSSALNAGLRFVSAGLVVTLDADSILKKDALSYMNGAFEDENLAAAGGAIHILQGYDPVYNERRSGVKKKPIVMLQILEYAKGFYIYKMSLSRQRALAIISGAFGVFRKEILTRVGGYRDTLGEDIDITMRIQRLIHKTHMRIEYLPQSLCYTQCPENWKDLKKQRIRWQKGFIECVGHHKFFLLKTFLSKSLSFHFLIEAMVIGICSCIFTIFTFIFVAVLAFMNFQALLTFAYYFAFCAVFNVVYSLGSFVISLKYNRYPAGVIKRIWLALAFDLLFYRYFNMFMYLGGTAAYLWNSENRKNWDKVQRARRELVSPNAQV